MYLAGWCYLDSVLVKLPVGRTGAHLISDGTGGILESIKHIARVKYRAEHDAKCSLGFCNFRGGFDDVLTCLLLAFRAFARFRRARLRGGGRGGYLVKCGACGDANGDNGGDNPCHTAN